MCLQQFNIKIICLKRCDNFIKVFHKQINQCADFMMWYWWITQFCQMCSIAKCQNVSVSCISSLHMFNGMLPTGSRHSILAWVFCRCRKGKFVFCCCKQQHFLCFSLVSELLESSSVISLSSATADSGSLSSEFSFWLLQTEWSEDGDSETGTSEVSSHWLDCHGQLKKACRTATTTLHTHGHDEYSLEQQYHLY